jgi:hypothetical protein
MKIFKMILMPILCLGFSFHILGLSPQAEKWHERAANLRIFNQTSMGRTFATTATGVGVGTIIGLIFFRRPIRGFWMGGILGALVGIYAENKSKKFLDTAANLFDKHALRIENKDTQHKQH